MCSNKGTCQCGVCECDEAKSFGEYCHCDDSLCPLYNGEICGGAEKGVCICEGVCLCTDKYENGPQGQCSCLKQGTAEAQLACADPEEPLGELCNGFGACVCGECKCEVGDNILDPNYEGRYCEVIIQILTICSKKLVPFRYATCALNRVLCSGPVSPACSTLAGSPAARDSPVRLQC